MDFDDEDDTPSRWVKLLYYLWKIFTCLFLHLILIATVVGYCFLGSYMFHELEKDFEIEMKKNISYIRGNITEDIWVYTNKTKYLEQINWTTEVSERLKDFETQIIWAMRKGGWDGVESNNTLKWTRSGALFYSIIVITTIGYGHIAPKTAEGKVATIFYAIVGIPLMLLCLSNIGDVMAHSFRFIYWRICCYKCTQPPKRIPPPIGYPRRTRSLRGASVRGPHRSRTTSFRHSGGRTSQRSADSAIGMSDGYARSSYSDTECRYYDEMEREQTMLGERFNRQSQQSRYSDNVTMYHTAPPHHHRRGIAMQPITPAVDRQIESAEYLSNSPVLFNRYALDREDSRRMHSRRREQPNIQRPRERTATHLSPHSHPSPTPRRRRELEVPPRHEEYHPSPKYKRGPRSTSSGRSQKENIGPSPRILTPLGFAVHRQTYPRPPRDIFYDDYYDYYYDYMDAYNSADYTKPVPIWLCVFLVVSYIIGGAFLFDKTERDWGFFNSAYFCFITLTTIGFGDYVPQQKPGADAEIGIAICSLYLLFGIALLAMSFNLVQEEVINNVKTVARHLGIIKDEDEEE